jgi:Kef-type K+ transport system membrane component KefB
MRMLASNTASKVGASIAVWFVVFLMFYFGGFTFSPSEDWRRTIVGGVLLATATFVSVLICSSRAGCGRERWKS